jgi:hypothetical protein
VNSFTRGPVVLAAVLLFTAGGGGLSASFAGIVLNEILADPASDWNVDGVVSSRDDEWAEIYNTGPDPVNLAGYRLAGPDSVWRYEFTGVLAPNAVQVVYGRQSYDWETANGFPAFGLRLGNTGGELLLFRMDAGVATLVDCYAYADHEADDDRSSGRGPDGGPTWLLFDALNPWTGSAQPAGSGCLPSPGLRMSCPTPTVTVTWSRIKSVMGAGEERR